MDLTDPKLLVGGTAATFLVYLIAVFFTRASPRRALGALLAGAALTPLVWFYDKIAARWDLWQYPSLHGASAPLLIYVANAFFYGGALGLIGWRVIRRWGRTGLIAFVILFGLFGAVRDYGYSLTTGLISFGRGALSLLADFSAYASGALIVQALMRWIVGPAASDPLRAPLRGGMVTPLGPPK